MPSGKKPGRLREAKAHSRGGSQRRPGLLNRGLSFNLKANQGKRLLQGRVFKWISTESGRAFTKQERLGKKKEGGRVKEKGSDWRDGGGGGCPERR